MQTTRLNTVRLLFSLFFAVLLSPIQSHAGSDVQALADRLEVLELSSRYAWGVDAVDREELARVFAPDAVAEYIGVGANALALNERLKGFDAIFDWLHRNLGHRKGTEGLPVHFVTNQIVELHGDRADLRYYMHNRWMAAGGVYYVEAIRTPKGWRIAKLRLEEQTWKPDHYAKDTNASQYMQQSHTH